MSAFWGSSVVSILCLFFFFSFFKFSLEFCYAIIKDTVLPCKQCRTMMLTSSCADYSSNRNKRIQGGRGGGAALNKAGVSVALKSKS